MQNSDPEGRNFLSAPNTNVLHTFRFRIFHCKSSFHYNTKWRRHMPFYKFGVIVTSQWRHLNDKVTWRPIQPMQTESIWWFSTHGWDNMGEIRISIPSEKLGIPYPVCKKSFSHYTICDRLWYFEPYGAKNWKFCFPHFHSANDYSEK